MISGAEVAETRPDGVGEPFGDFFDRVLPRAVGLAWRLIGSQEAAEDVAVEAFARAYVEWARLGTLPYRDAWLLRVAANVAYDQLRRERVARRRAASPATAQSQTDTVELRVTLVAALRKLTDRQRQAVVLTEIGGLPLEEVAHVMGVATGTAKSHLHRGLVRLRSEMGEGAEL